MVAVIHYFLLIASACLRPRDLFSGTVDSGSLVNRLLDIHTCTFSVVRLQVRYRGNPYDLEECEGCGALQLASSTGQERRIVSSSSGEFDDVMDFFEFLVRRARETVLATM